MTSLVIDGSTTSRRKAVTASLSAGDIPNVAKRRSFTCCPPYVGEAVREWKVAA
jgi:hypothetical protein